MELTLLVIAVLTIVSAIKSFAYLKSYFQKWLRFRHFPGPREMAYPFIGHGMLLRGDPNDFYVNMVKLVKENVMQCGREIGLIWVGPVPVVMVIGPNAAEVLLRSSKHMEKSFFYTFLHSWLGTGLLTAGGEKWKQRRKLITPTFHFSILQDFLEVMNEQANVFATKLESFAKTGRAFNISKPVTLCALDIICETAMGKSIYAQENKDSNYVKALYRSSQLIQDRQKSPWLWPNFSFNHTKKGKDYSACLDTLHTFTNSVIQDRMKTFSTDAVPNKKKRLAFLDLLLSVSEGGKVLSPSDIQEEVDTFMFEGHDTTAAAMSWALHLIGSHPDIQQRIQDELDEVLGANHSKKISMEDVRKLDYLEMVIKESLRLFPSVPFFGRVTTSECTLDGYHIPKGTECILITQLLNKNPNFWSDAERFDPERFTTDNSVGRHPFSYLPFSAGPRNCIGQRFALMEEKVMLAYLLRHFSVQSCDATEDLRLMGDLILRSENGINVKIKRRQEEK